MTQNSTQKQSLRYRTVLTIAGSDSGGGAGIQADIKTIAALGCYATTAITALTAQNTTGVQAVYPVSAGFLGQQIASVCEDIGADAVKIGMFASLENLEIIEAALKRYRMQHVVFDPVMMSSSGASLLVAQSASPTSPDEGAAQIVKESGGQDLITRVLAIANLSSLFTPNLLEAEFLTKIAIRSLEDMEEAGRALISKGLQAVLVKGGHRLDAKGYPSAVVTDVLIQKNAASVIFESPRLESKNLHGTGCTLSSAIASYLAKGLSLEEAVSKGREFLIKAIKSGSGIRVGGGLVSLGSSFKTSNALTPLNTIHPIGLSFRSGPLNHGFNPIPADFRAVDD